MDVMHERDFMRLELKSWKDATYAFIAAAVAILVP